MKYSYIKPRKKSLFTPDMQLLGVFFGITIFMLLCTYLFLVFKDYRFTQDRIDIIELREETSSEINLIEKNILFIQEEQVLSESIFTKNTVLKDSISNMFDLVPQRITLSEAKLLENGLVLYGITPNKDIYNFMLQAPLRSIFHRTYSSFYPVKNGWLRFVSTNYIDKEEESEEEEYEEDVEYED
ncbi:MAG: hypothetical protein ACI9TV_000566 [Sulfurimonas sp.]|jgi:hypothetical protein|uniref:hypothetical protein n=1 Tax=Sulfurimonas sp. TaxID=2022749 RepID=UPI0039E231A3